MIKRLIFLSATLFAGVTSASIVTFTPLPSDITATSGSTVGWGYSISNQTAYWVVSFGLANSGIVNGSITDIFDYPVVDPGQTVAQNYAFNPPGGFGNSVGLFEYSVPTEAPAGFVESGTFTFTYQLFTANPDLNPMALSVGNTVDQSAPFSATISSPISTVPEPGTVGLFCIGASLLIACRGVRGGSRRRVQVNLLT
jgi:hypothetical protein